MQFLEPVLVHMLEFQVVGFFRKNQIECIRPLYLLLLLRSFHLQVDLFPAYFEQMCQDLSRWRDDMKGESRKESVSPSLLSSSSSVVDDSSPNRVAPKSLHFSKSIFDALFAHADKKHQA